METVAEFVQLIKENVVHCFTCQTPITDITYYGPHDGGIWLREGPGANRRVWAYLHCPKCNYDTSFWKVGNQVGQVPAREGEISVGVFEEQSNIDRALGQVIKDSSKPWKGICSHACWFARRKPCKCRCKRTNHQRGIQKQITDFVMTPSGPIERGLYEGRLTKEHEEAKKAMAEYNKLLFGDEPL